MIMLKPQQQFCLWLRFIVAFVLFCPVFVNANTLQSIRYNFTGNKAKMVLSFPDTIKYKIFTLRYPERLVIDLENTQLKTASQTVPSNAFIKKLRSAKRQPNDLRLVFDLKKNVTFEHSIISAQASMPHRLLVQLKALNKQDIKKAKKPHLTVAKRVKARDVVIVIDPGHGGKDPGAIGARGTKEKQIVLSIAKKIKKLFDKEPGMRAVLTRRGDYYVGLRQRLTVARKQNADIFLAIHADAFPKRTSSGASVFALSQRGASSEAARWLAEHENHSELGEASLVDKSYILRSVLIDLSQTATISASLKLGTQVLKQLANMTKLHNYKVEQAGFVVLKSPDIPSILIETGFISNPREELQLRNEQYQMKMAKAIFRGLKQYFWQNPPPGSIIALKQHA